MGWLSMPLDSMGGHTSPKAYLDAQFTYTNTREDGSCSALTVLASSCQNNRVYYAAVQRLDDDVPGDIFAIVCPVRWNPRAADGYVFAYKDIDETAGPCEAECPERILRLLTPTAHQYAQDWRRRCYDNLKLRARKIENGMRIKLPAPMTFTDGHVGDEFIIIKAGASISLRPLDGHGRYRISNFRSRAWSPVPATTVHRTVFGATPAE